MYIYNTIYNYYIHYFIHSHLLIKVDSNKFSLLSAPTPSTIIYKTGKEDLEQPPRPPLFCCHACHASRFYPQKYVTTPTPTPHGTKRCASYLFNPRLTKSPQSP